MVKLWNRVKMPRDLALLNIETFTRIYLCLVSGCNELLHLSQAALSTILDSYSRISIISHQHFANVIFQKEVSGSFRKHPNPLQSLGVMYSH